MSTLIKHTEVEEFTKSNNSNSIPHFVGNEVFEVAGWVFPRLQKFKKKQILLKENEMNVLDLVKERDEIVNAIDHFYCEMGSETETVLLTDDECQMIINSLEICKKRIEHILKKIDVWEEL